MHREVIYFSSHFFRVFRAFRGWSFFLSWETNHGTHGKHRKETSALCSEYWIIMFNLYSPRVQFYLTGAMGCEPRNTQKAQKKARRGSRNPNCHNRFPPAQAGFLLLFRKNIQISPKTGKNMYEQTVNTPLTSKPKSWPVSSLFQTLNDTQ